MNLVWSITIGVSVGWLSYPRKLISGLYFQPGLLAVSALVAFVALISFRQWRFPWIPWPIVAYLAICASSAGWSVAPDRTWDSVLLYSGLAALASIAVAFTDTQTFLRGVAWGGALIVISNAIAILINPIEFAGPWVGRPFLGLQGNRNTVAFTLVLALAAALARRVRSKGARVEACLTLAVLVAGLIQTTSMTGIGAGAALAVAASFVWWLRRCSPRQRRIALISAGALGLIGTTVAIFSWEQLSRTLAKGADLNGRLGIWDAVLTVWRDAPLTGFGWGAFWEHGWDYDWMRLGRSAPFERFTQITQAWIPHGHNVVLDILPELGLLGVLGVALIHVMLAVRGLRRRPATTSESTFALLVLVALLLNGLTEPILSTPVGWWVATAALALARRPATRGTEAPNEANTDAAPVMASPPR